MLALNATFEVKSVPSNCKEAFRRDYIEISIPLLLPSGCAIFKRYKNKASSPFRAIKPGRLIK